MGPEEQPFQLQQNDITQAFYLYVWSCAHCCSQLFLALYVKIHFVVDAEKKLNLNWLELTQEHLSNLGWNKLNETIWELIGIHTLSASAPVHHTKY